MQKPLPETTRLLLLRAPFPESSERPFHQQKEEKSKDVNEGIRREGALPANRNRTGLLAQCQAPDQGYEQIKDTAEDPRVTG